MKNVLKSGSLNEEAKGEKVGLKKVQACTPPPQEIVDRLKIKVLVKEYEQGAFFFLWEETIAQKQGQQREYRPIGALSNLVHTYISIHITSSTAYASCIAGLHLFAVVYNCGHNLKKARALASRGAFLVKHTRCNSSDALSHQVQITATGLLRSALSWAWMARVDHPAARLLKAFHYRSISPLSILRSTSIVSATIFLVTVEIRSPYTPSTPRPFSIHCSLSQWVSLQNAQPIHDPTSKDIRKTQKVSLSWKPPPFRLGLTYGNHTLPKKQDNSTYQEIKTAIDIAGRHTIAFSCHKICGIWSHYLSSVDTKHHGGWKKQWAQLFVIEDPHPV